MERSHQPGEIIAQRYRIVKVLGQGGTGVTYEAQDESSNQRIALKKMSLRRLREWKDLELFEREAKVLSYLDHPTIPKYLDYFEVDTPENRLFYIVQELAPGRSLFSLVEQGWRGTEDEVKDIACQILETLIYLHSLKPPIIHRDIKPQNLIRHEDGQMSLVDFGSVRQAYWNRRNQGVTVVGTFGYMAPEQDRGQAYPASDLYGLAATLLFLLTHRPISELPQRRLKIDFRSRIQVTPELADWLEKMLEPLVEDRFLSARAALTALQQPPKVRPPVVSTRRKPVGSRICLTQTQNSLLVDIPPANFGVPGGHLSSPALVILIVLLIPTVFIVLPLVLSITLQTVLSIIGIVLATESLFTLLLILFILFNQDASSLKWIRSLLSRISNIQVQINQRHFKLVWKLLNVKYRQVEGKTAKIERIDIVTKYLSSRKKLRDGQLTDLRCHQVHPEVAATKNIDIITKQLRKKIGDLDTEETISIPVKNCAIVTKTLTGREQCHEFAQFLTQLEKEWLVEEVRLFLKKLRSQIE
ncbi:MAG: serine/threonine protein kinase [Symploca sp. SIO2D2]|nr:serine/threonine protein kinase [Symploca sp. SIO2D2]